MDTEKRFNVKNRSAGMVVYNIPELNIRREFAPSETKVISFMELEKLSYQSGGRELMTNYLQIIEEQATEALGVTREPEYNMSEADIVNLIKTGSLDAFLDCLDFAPEGVIDLVKQFAVAIPMNDIQKIRALKEKTGFDVNAALRHIEEEREEDKPEGTGAPQRRIQPAEGVATGGRRTTPKYNVTKKGE